MNKDRFEIWLKNSAEKDSGGKLKETTRKTIMSNLHKSIPDHLRIDSLFEIDDLNTISEFQSKIVGSEFDERKNNSPKQALKFYKQFLSNALSNDSKEDLSVDIPLKKYTKNYIKNITLYGVPGVGKTHNTNKLISLLEIQKSEHEIFTEIENNTHNDGAEARQLIENIQKRVKFVTFHQSFGYEDFIEGFRPNKEGHIELRDGIFKTICKEASEDESKNYYLVIDEINRGNISKIFGELITLIEEDKRDTLEVTLPYSKEPFSIPKNLFIIATMNSTDKSIALIDIALRRRFTFIKLYPNLELVQNPDAKTIMMQLNLEIEKSLGKDYLIGHSYFIQIEDDSDLEFVKEYKIKPLLEEYYYGDNNGLEQALNILN